MALCLMLILAGFTLCAAPVRAAVAVGIAAEHVVDADGTANP